MTNAFHETNLLFTEYLNYSRPYSYVEWLALSNDNKAAALFVQFYEQITLAWFKTRSYYADDEMGVSTMIQYLMKNVPLIIADPKRFSPKYIYKVAYNCLYCICHDIKRDKDRAENEMSNIISSGEDEFNLFDAVPDFDTDTSVEDELWAIIYSMGPKAVKAAYHLMNGDSLKKMNKNAAMYNSDPLRDIEVSLDELDAIIAELRVKLAKFSDMM